MPDVPNIATIAWPFAGLAITGVAVAAVGGGEDGTPVPVDTWLHIIRDVGFPIVVAGFLLYWFVQLARLAITQLGAVLAELTAEMRTLNGNILHLHSAIEDFKRLSDR